MSTPKDLLQNLEHLNAPQLRRLLTEHLTKQKFGCLDPCTHAHH